MWGMFSFVACFVKKDYNLQVVELPWTKPVYVAVQKLIIF